MPIFTEILENPKQINRKIARIEPDRDAEKNKSTPEAQHKNIILLLIVAIAGSVALFWKKITNARRRISTQLKRDKMKATDQDADAAFARASVKLAKARNMDRSDLGAYYYELNKILWSAITEKVKLLPTELSKGNIFLELSRQGWTPEEVWELELTMNEYERNLYVPGYQDENDFEGSYDNALRIITKLESLGR